MTTTGQILKTYEYDHDKRSFTLPWKTDTSSTWNYGTDEITNKDICFVNRTSCDSGHIVVLNASGKLELPNSNTKTIIPTSAAETADVLLGTSCTRRRRSTRMGHAVTESPDLFVKVILSDNCAPGRLNASSILSCSEFTSVIAFLKAAMSAESNGSEPAGVFPSAIMSTN
ncbi:hypothetical protein KUTeg_016457 [Tegillarca granosa]|uniref:Uncharacterized protein n=1 Tax=Tegillarca granosa TaxID=220873 RepID=A0ABQ9EPQ1_TEGGR|nr:hypothetical protein KUTeg_016457 [Tegillarca granosa]